MHHHEGASDNGEVRIGQFDADRCCAASEPSSSTLAFSAVPALMVLRPVMSPVVRGLLPTDRRPGFLSMPAPRSEVPTHVLLSVFLV
jgi:hypothetical protein